MNKHTPGPWHWDCDPIKDDPFNRVRYRVTTIGKTIAQTYYSSSDENAKANTRLIAAAPELYEAVKNCVTVLAHVSERMGMKVDHPFLEELRAVLAKVDA